MSDASPTSTDILIVGAGLAGLLAATDFYAKGLQTFVVEKGRGVGGRLATRRIGSATFDHGAQFITARAPRFAALLDEWHGLGLLTEWYRGVDDEHIRWRGTPSMTAVAKHLAKSLNVGLEMKMIALKQEKSGWLAVFENGKTLAARSVLLTAPVPQALALLDAGGVMLEESVRAQLEAIDYEPCLAVMAILKDQSNIPEPGFIRPESDSIAWMADNFIKGVSTMHAVTLHATPEFSRKHWDANRQETGKLLLAAATPWLGSPVAEFQVHGWRYARPASKQPQHPCLVLNEKATLVIAGDAFGGPRVEGAALSGWAAAATQTFHEGDVGK
jgi:renalase